VHFVGLFFSSIMKMHGQKKKIIDILILYRYYSIYGVCGGVVVKALRYKPADRGFDPRWYHWNFSVT